MKIPREIMTALIPPENETTYSANDLQSLLSIFVDKEFPKGKDRKRGEAIFYISLFIVWLEKNIKSGLSAASAQDDPKQP